MPKFRKGEAELETAEDSWLFSLRHMNAQAGSPDGEGIYEPWCRAEGVQEGEL